MSFIYILIIYMYYWADVNLRQNPSFLEDLFQEAINKLTKNMSNIDHYHGHEMRHM